HLVQLPHNIFEQKQIASSDRPVYCRPVSVKYDALTASEIARVSTVKVNTEILYDENRNRQPYGPLDLRFGPSERNLICKECGESIMACPGCPGHFGYVPLALPVFHPGFYKHIYHMAQCMCKSCGRLLLDDKMHHEAGSATSGGTAGGSSS
ncbi:unnamed protein product, partial [Amoebophrya sp. A120]